MFKRKNIQKCIAVFLAVLILGFSIAPSYALNAYSEPETVPPCTEITEELTAATAAEETDAAAETSSPTEAPGETKEETPDETQEETREATQDETPPVYRDGVILLYSYAQLCLLGTDAVLTDADHDPETVGTGSPVTDQENTITYSASASYAFVQDIPLPAEELWLLPEDFTGGISPLEEGEDPVLYDAETDTLYLFHPYQLAVLEMDDAQIQPVLTGDAVSETFGTGQPVQKQDGSVLTYGTAGRLVLSASFTSEVNRSPSVLEENEDGPRREGTRAADAKAGRDFVGQVIKKIDGVTYILIGNEDQLRAIGSDQEVFTPVYQTDLTLSGHVLDLDNDGNPIMLYGGDADLLASQNGNSDFTFHTIRDKTRSARYYTGVNQDTGEPYLDAAHCNLTKAAGGWQTGEYYTIKANYIVFRDIDLQSSAWTPLMFAGTMYGSKSLNGEKLWDGTGIGDSTELTQLDAAHRPQIQNVLVNQTGTLYVNEYMGIGFFATITNRTNTANIGVSGGTAIVQNIELHDVSVSNASTTADVNQTLLNAVTSTLGTVLGGLLDGLLWVLSFGSANTDLNRTLSNLLNAKAQDPTAFATGCFAGRVVGDVRIEDCCVTGTVQVSNVKDRTAGFIGYSTGFTEYSGLSQVLGGLVDVLSGILNLVPAVGLGDLITILLGNALPLDSLIPTGYIDPIIKNSYVDGLTGNVGQTDRDFAAGFIAHQIGTRVEGCTVRNSDYTVRAQNYGGGFAGLARDAEIRGTLDGVGIDLSSIIQNIHPQSVLKDCAITGSDLTVTGGNMLGGFIGAMCSSYAVDCSVNLPSNDPLSVNGTGDAVGGFCGYATVGWQSTMGKTENTENSLLGTVRQLAANLLSTNPSQGQKLLSLMGVAPSALLGCQVNCSALTVQAGDATHDADFAGGFLGKGDGIYLAPSDSQSYTEIAAWNSGTLDETPNNRAILLNGLQSVRATRNFAGGVAGYLGSAAFQGLLNDVVGLGDFIGFHVRSVSVTGVNGGYWVKADGDNAGGGFGATVGGTVDQVVLQRLQSVEANNRAAGFVGLSGPGELAGTGGLTVNLLGLNNVLNVSNLLNVGQGLEVHITNSSVTGVDAGFTVEALGVRSGGSVIQYTASGFVAKSNSTKITNSHTYQLRSVTATENGGYAGGFIGTSETGGLADVADETSVRSLLQVDGLVTAIGYLLPSYTNCTVHYVDGGWVDADLAGGFVADFMSGTVDNSTRTRSDGNDPPAQVPDPYAVYNVDRVYGRTYAGGFGGRVVSGALANAAKGVSVLGGLSSLNIGIDELVGVVNAYVPFVKYAGVYSEHGFTVEARTVRSADLTSGSAGGFIGYASGAQVTHSDVNKLKHTEVTPPDDLEAVNAPSYFSIGTGAGQSSYAVTGGNYAGGYVGDMDIGSAASLGHGLNILGSTIGLTDALKALNVVVTTIEHSDVYGAPGGFSVLATGRDGDDGMVGRSGGFAGAINGGHIQNSDCKNFYYIIGEIAAGGYVGEMQPGEVARLLDDGNVLGNLIDIDSSLASLVQDFVPTIRNSTTSCVPCGGAVRAHSPSDSAIQRGMAGGYCGHNKGGHIWGYDNHTWKDQNDGVIFDNTGLERQTNDPNQGRYTGPKNECRADRIRSVYGYEYAGGFTGLMEPANTAETGGVSLLGGLLARVQNPLNALAVVYPTEENTAIYGPLWHLDVATWNAWVTYVGRFGGYGAELAQLGTVSSQAQLDALLTNYIYGCNVVAGRSTHIQTLISEGGDAGGYVGLMLSGTVTNGQTYDIKLVRSMRSTGGFAGRLQTGGAASFGSVSLFGGTVNLNLGKLLQTAEVFVPVIKSSSTRGYRSGLVVECTGTNQSADCGYAGGYVGSSYGGQIWGDEGNTLYTDSGTVSRLADGCNILRLRAVRGRNAVGGFAGLVTAASVANANTNASTGFLQGLLNSVIGSPGDLASVLQATMSTIRKATVTPDDADYGIVIGGLNGVVPNFAGGFVGTSEAAVIGSRTGASTITVNGLRSVDGGLYAGGFFGLADVTSVASVSGSGQSSTSILGLLNLQRVSVLDAFRTYVYYSNVSGVPEGAVIRAHRTDTEGILSETRHAGCAGGFGGGLMNGTVTHSSVTNLNTVSGLNYVGGFVGHMGKNGVADVDAAKVLNLLGLTAGVLDVFGSQIEDCTVTGIYPGAVTKAEGGAEPIAGGFCGYADISRIKRSHTTSLKQVYSDQIAGGFVGKTEMQYLVEVHADSPVVDLLLSIVNALLKILYVNGLENLNLIDTTQYPILNTLQNVLGIKLLADGDLLYINLLGLRVGVSLVRATEPGQTDTAIVTIGDSSVRLPCTDQRIDTAGANEEIAVNLIKGNRTKVEDCTVTGIDVGYDVYGGGAGNNADGSHTKGYAGGFVGYNNEGHLLNNEMFYCDVVRGTANKVGPFSGTTSLQSVYSFNTLASIEGENNTYSVYREADPAYRYALSSGGTPIGLPATQDTQTGVTYNRYRVLHLAAPISTFSDWENALMSKNISATDPTPINVYESAAKAVLMRDTPTEPNDLSTVPAPAPMQDPCAEELDLTIHKRWLDANDRDGIRPASIRVRIWIYKLDENGQYLMTSDPEPVRQRTLYLSGSLPTDADGWFELTAANDGSIDTNVWTKVITGLPVYEKELDPVTGDETGRLIYYRYEVEEAPVNRYVTEIVRDSTGTEFTVTNTHHSPLPLTGGPGDYLFILLGVLFIFIGLYYRKIQSAWRRKRYRMLPYAEYRSSA